MAWVRCRGEEAEEVIREARAIIARRGLPVYWILDPGTEPADFTDHLARFGAQKRPAATRVAWRG